MPVIWWQSLWKIPGVWTRRACFAKLRVVLASTRGSIIRHHAKDRSQSSYSCSAPNLSYKKSLIYLILILHQQSWSHPDWRERKERAYAAIHHQSSLRKWRYLRLWKTWLLEVRRSMTSAWFRYDPSCGPRYWTLETNVVCCTVPPFRIPLIFVYPLFAGFAKRHECEHRIKIARTISGHSQSLSERIQKKILLSYE